MIFLVPINESVNGGSQTVHRIDTESTNPKVNKRKLRAYFIEMGVPKHNVKKVMKAMGFWGDRLGVLQDERKT